MIAPLVERVAPRVTAADLVARSDDTVAVTVDDRGDVAVFEDRSASLHARVTAGGRMGWAAGAGEHADRVVDAAVASARVGPELDLMLPAPAPLPEVLTSVAATARAGAAPLLALARALRDRLAVPGRRVTAWAERSAGDVQVANTRGVVAAYSQTLAGVGALVWGGGVEPGDAFRIELVSAELPGYPELDGMAARVDRYAGVPVLDAWETGPQRAWLAPRAVRTVLGPVLWRLAGEQWVARTERALPALDGRITLVDDPHAPARPGSRPVCDDGIPTWPRTLVERGVPVAGILDLATAVRHGVPATGHGVRRPGGAPRAVFSNVRLLPGDRDGPPEAAVGSGLLVLDLPWGPAPSRAAGVLRARAPWTLLVRDGTVVGRLEGAVLSGDVFELLRSVEAVGRDVEWLGAWALPGLLVDGILLGR